jgi:hypothetical protein
LKYAGKKSLMTNLGAGREVRFQDSTDLTVVVDPALTFSATYSEWKKGERVLKRWPVVRS